MILVESHKLKRKSKYQSLYENIDSYCYTSKNLRNYTNYIIKQCSRIHYKLQKGEIIDSWDKSKAKLQTISKIANNKEETCHSRRLTQRRNNKVKDYMHKTSRIIVDLALNNNVGKIIIGNNQGWKQEVDIGKRNNQNFVTIPYLTLINMIKYKAELVGIEVIVTEESYTSGTSYYDDEMPTKANYNKSRRKTRGQFVSNSGIKINADVNGSYQIMKKVKIMPPIKYNEKVVRLKVA